MIYPAVHKEHMLLVFLHVANYRSKRHHTVSPWSFQPCSHAPHPHKSQHSSTAGNLMIFGCLSLARVTRQEKRKRQGSKKEEKKIASGNVVLSFWDSHDISAKASKVTWTMCHSASSHFKLFSRKYKSQHCDRADEATTCYASITYVHQFKSQI